MYKKKATAISLPQSKTAKIMTSAVGVESVNPDIVALATKATEIFLQDFARRAYDQSSDEEFRSNVLEYDDIQKLVHSDSRYDFLIDTTPKRIKFSEALQLVEEANLKSQEQEQINQEKALVKKQQKSQKAAAAAKKSEEVTSKSVAEQECEPRQGEESESCLENTTKDSHEEREEKADQDEEANDEDHQESQDDENESRHTDESEHGEDR